jgi:cytochrome o ubiquinol oxidase subunit 1
MSPIFGKLTWSAIPFQEPIPLYTSIVIILALAAIALWITRVKAWPFLWNEYFTSTDHKRIGVMYITLGLVMLVRGFADAVMMRSHQYFAVGAGQGYLSPEHYDQIFTAHGTIMIFFVAMPLVIGFMNFVVPLQLGVRDVAFPTMNNVSFWLTASGALLVNVSLFLGEFARTGWLAFPPLSEKMFSPGVGVDYYLVALQISGVGTILTAVNFVTTILKTRAPGMSYLRMPVFCWTALASNLIMLAAFPVLTVALAELMLDRYLGFHFFTNDGGGNSMLYMNLIWVWGHPEVYILVLPAFGIYSEIASTFSGKPLFGYRSMVFATLVICILSYCVWLHHFFTMGAGADVNAVFGIASMLIGIPTGVKIYNWLFTMYGGRVRFTVPMHYLIGFMLLFVGGGLTGVLLAMPPVDFIVHNSLFLVAHFHHVIIPGVVFAILAGYTYWFPKAFGFTLDERLGKAAFWCWFVGFNLAFMPSYLLGFWGGTRRMQHISDPTWKPWLGVELIGSLIIALGVVFLVVQLFYSIKTREQRRDLTGDPWDGRTLEWLTLSPPPHYNFAVLPDVHGEEAYWHRKQEAIEREALIPEPNYQPIEMPLNTPTGVIVAFFAAVCGFAVIWYIWWLAIVGLIGAFAVFVWYAWRDEHDHVIPVEEVIANARERRRIRMENLHKLSQST